MRRYGSTRSNMRASHGKNLMAASASAFNTNFLGAVTDYEAAKSSTRFSMPVKPEFKRV